uniref:Nuclear pore protein n=1 Tax=Biomphalaria glabrata TaxID=6526 RepID=A0A2C9L0J0_BIOGL
MNGDTEGFTDLLQQAEQLTAEMDSGTDLPHVERNLQQILEAGQRLLTRTTPVSQDNIDVQARIPFQWVPAAISLLPSSLHHLPVFVYNEHVIDNGILPSLVDMFVKVATNIGDQNVLDMWQLVQCMIEIPLGQTFGSQPSVIRKNSQIQAHFISRAKHYLQQNYVRYLEKTVSSNLRQAQLGGIPGTYNLVHSYLNVKPPVMARSSEDGELDKQPVWALLFYCLRCGDLKAAKHVVDRAGNQLGDFPTYFNEYVNSVDHKLAPGSDTKIKLQYRRVVKNCSDPYKRAVYCVIGCCDWTDDHTEILDKIDDYLWMKLSHVQDQGTTDTSQDQLTLTTLQKILYEDYGKLSLFVGSYFSLKPNNYGIFNYMTFEEVDKNNWESMENEWEKEKQKILNSLLGSGLESFEFQQDPEMIISDSLLSQGRSSLDHIEMAYAREKYFNVETKSKTHISRFTSISVSLTGSNGSNVVAALRPSKRSDILALVLYEMKMLIIPPNCQAQLLSQDPSDSHGLKRLNIARLVMMYTRKFEATDPREALQYFYFLRNLKTPTGDDLFKSCVSELVLETKEFDMLLGRLEKDGSRKPGAIDSFKQDTQKITEMVAKDTEAKGLFEDAVRLYDLAKDHEKALSLMNKLLSQVVSIAPSPQSTRDRLTSIALNMAERYTTFGHEACQMTTKTFFLLLDLITFFNFCHEGAITKALDVMQGIKILPFSAEEVDHRVSNFKNYSDEIRRCLPDILLATMNILLTQYNNARASTIQSPMSLRRGIEDGGKDSYLNYLRNQARAIIMFAGMLPYRLPGDTNARLVQIDVLMS